MFNYINEFNYQVNNLISKGYHKLANLSEQQFIDIIDPLKENLSKIDFKEIDIENGYLPFVIVIRNTLIESNKLVNLIEKDGRNGVEKLFPLKINDFNNIEEIPNSHAYILFDIDRGKKTLNITPNDAFKIIKKENRIPLTIEEGIAIVTQYPQFLIKNNCFSLLASRHTGDKRVPALWINSKKEVNLGWCWDGNPHTWLGSASATSRITS